MSDATNLRTILARTDASAPAIQQAAGAMMKHYDRSASVAVTEWRNVLQQARPDQHLPLLYVANEVLQNSKRNRGNKFLEAFSPILGQSLIWICQKSSMATVEKVRRTAKIWAERHVLSIRFVNELLKGLEPYRNIHNSSTTSTSTSTKTQVAAATSILPPSSLNGIDGTSGANSDTVGGPSFSPLHDSHQTSSSSSPPQSSSSSSGAAAMATTSPRTNSKSTKKVIDIDKAMMSMNSDDDMDSRNDEAGDENSDDDLSENDDDLFGNSGDRLLKVDVDLDKAASEANNKKKRRRSKNTNSTNGKKGGSNESGSGKRRSTVLSTNTLMELWNAVSTLQQRFDSTQTLLAAITPEDLDASSDQIDTLVGDSLLEAYQKNQSFQKRVVDQRKELHAIAKQRRSLEQEAVRYIPWLESALQQDTDDIVFCDKVLVELEKYKTIHPVAKAAREERLLEEAKLQRKREDEEQRKKEEADRKQFMEIAMARQTEAKPGMVWSKALGEYVYPNTEESWRD